MEISVGQIPFRERLWCSVAEACQVTGEGRTNIYKKIASGQIVSKKEGARRLISVPPLLKEHSDDTVNIATTQVPPGQVGARPATPARYGGIKRSRAR
jgi:hypothetical protein